MVKYRYEENYRKVRMPKSKIDDELIPNCLNFEINNIENKNEREFVDRCLDLVKSIIFINSNEKERNILRKNVEFVRKQEVTKKY